MGMYDFFEDAARDGVESHIRAITGPETDVLALALTAELVDRCWPGGIADRSESIARGWLRMWGPVKVIAALPGCTCATGRCPVCN